MGKVKDATCINTPLGARLLLGGLGRVDVLPHASERAFRHLVRDVDRGGVTPGQRRGDEEKIKKKEDFCLQRVKKRRSLYFILIPPDGHVGTLKKRGTVPKKEKEIYFKFPSSGTCTMPSSSAMMLCSS